MTGVPTDSRAAGPDWLRLIWAGLCAVLFWRTLCMVQLVQWNPPRLTPSFALAAGLNFYGTREAGPFLGWVYGPVFPLYMLPAALVPGLNAAFAVAWALNLAAFLGPAWLVARQALPTARAAALALLLWCVLSVGAEATQFQFYFLHVDALCIGLSLLAGWSLVRALERPQAPSWLHAAAGGAALAIWTKQPAAAVPVILALWLVAGGHRRLAGRFFLWAVAYSGLLGVIFLRWFGGEQILFNLVWVHVHNPARPEGYAVSAGQLLASSPGWLVAALGAVWLARTIHRPAAAPARGIASLLVWLAVGSLPLGLLATSKVAAGWNSLHTLNYALLWLALDLARRAGAAEGRASGRLVPALACATLLLTGWRAANTADLPWRPATAQATELAHAREHAGHLYLPWNPLVTLITDRRIYPFDDALLCLDRVGMPAPAESVRREIPHGALVVYPEPAQSHFALRYLELAPAARP